MAGKGDRELIDTGTDKRYVRRDEKGQFKESDDVGRSLSQDVKRGEDRGQAGPGRPRRPEAEISFKFRVSSSELVRRESNGVAAGSRTRNLQLETRNSGFISRRSARARRQWSRWRR